MLLWGFWVLAALANPALANPALAAPATLLDPAQQRTPVYLALGLVLAAALLLIAVTARPAPVSTAAPGVRAFARRARTAPRPRLLDPDAAGRPRPRAPAARLAAA